MKVSEMRDDELVALYIQLRDRRAQRKGAYDIDDAGDKQKQEKIEALLLHRFQLSGIESVKTAMGTAYKSTRTSATVADWDMFFDFVKEGEAWELIEHRASKEAVVQYKAANDELPPGINWRSEVVINVRRG